jgi:hypothetical protein
MGKLLAPAAAALLVLGGCATKDDVDQLRSEIAGLRAAVEAGGTTHAPTVAPPAPPATSGVTAGPPPAGYEPASRFGLPAFMPGLGALYVRPQTLPVGPYLAYDRDDRLVSTVYMVPIADLVARKRFEDLAVADRDVQDVDLYYSPGHPGVVVPHYHFVLWYVPKAAAKLQ